MNKTVQKPMNEQPAPTPQPTKEPLNFKELVEQMIG